MEQQLNIILRRSEGEQHLSVEINGKIYEFVDIDTANEFVRQALIQAEAYLINSATRHPQ